MICSFEVFHAAAIDINETIDRALFELNYRVSIDLSSKLTKFEYLCYKIGGYEWTPPFEGDVTHHFTEDCAGHDQDTRDDLAAPVGGVKTSATRLLEPTIFERLWPCQPSFSRSLQLQHQAVLAEFSGGPI